LRERVPLLDRNGEDEIFFGGLNARSFYFCDAGSNILEFIVHYNLDRELEGTFDASHILHVSEIGLPVDDVPALAAQFEGSGSLLSRMEAPSRKRLHLWANLWTICGSEGRSSLAATNCAIYSISCANYDKRPAGAAIGNSHRSHITISALHHEIIDPQSKNKTKLPEGATFSCNLPHYPTASLKPRREESLLGGHAWIFSGALQQPPHWIEAGGLVGCEIRNGPVCCAWLLQSQTDIAIRILTHDPSEIIDATSCAIASIMPSNCAASSIQRTPMPIA